MSHTRADNKNDSRIRSASPHPSIHPPKKGDNTTLKIKSTLSLPNNLCYWCSSCQKEFSRQVKELNPAKNVHCLEKMYLVFTHTHTHTKISNKSDCQRSKTFCSLTKEITLKLLLVLSCPNKQRSFEPFICLDLVVTRMPCESYRRRLMSLLLYLCYVYRALINSLVW